MSVVAKIALRNVLRHRAKTLIIGILITIGIAVLVVGNSLMDTASRGIQQTYVHSYTGHIVITGRHDGGLSLMGIENADSLDAHVPTIPSFDQVFEFVTAQPYVEAVSPQATVFALVDYGENMSYTQAFGIDPEYYTEMFPDNIEIVSGRMLAPGEEGILLSETVAAGLERDGDVTVVPGDTVLLTAMSESAGIKVREVPIRGIFRFRHSNPQLDFVSLVDITNVRALAGMNLSSVAAAELTEQEAVLFGDLDEDALFGGLDLFFSDGLVESIDAPTRTWDEDELLAGLNLAPDTDRVPAQESNAWHFLLVKLQDGTNPTLAMLELQRFFDENDIDAMAAGWLAGAGSIALLANGTKAVFNVVVLVIAVVAVIIIMNTLVISVTERTVEIGTMRALGAQKKFVRRIIVWETILTSGIFGVLGVAVGLIILKILGATGIEAPNIFFEIMFGGKVLHPEPSFGAIVVSLIVVIAIGVVASLYPVRIALKVQPIKAMQE